MTVPENIRVVLMAIAATLVAWVSGAHATPAFSVGLTDLLTPGPGVGLVNFDTGGAFQGFPVGLQFAPEGAIFQNFRFDNGTLGQDSAPGFSGAGLVNGVLVPSNGNLVIQLTQPVDAASFAIADTGLQRTISYYLGGPQGTLVYSRTLALPASEPIALDQAMTEIANANGGVATTNAALDLDQLNINAAQKAVNLDLKLDNTINASLEQAQNHVAADKSKLAGCGADLLCFTSATRALVQDLSIVSIVQSQLTDAKVTLAGDQLALQLAQGQLKKDQAAAKLAQALLDIADADLKAAEQDGAGPGFVNLSGTLFDTIALSNAAIPTAIDDLTFLPLVIFGGPPPSLILPDAPGTAPEPATLALLGAALLALVPLYWAGRRRPH